MILIGHILIESECLYQIRSKDDILNTPSNSTVLFDFEESMVDLCRYCTQNDIEFALFVKDIREVVLSNALDAKYIVCKKKLSKKAQKVAEKYLFDAKILLLGEEKDIKWAVKSSIDGILFKKGIKDGSS
jgi:hypothetical protein